MKRSFILWEALASLTCIMVLSGAIIRVCSLLFKTHASVIMRVTPRRGRAFFLLECVLYGAVLVGVLAVAHRMICHSMQTTSVVQQSVDLLAHHHAWCNLCVDLLCADGCEQRGGDLWLLIGAACVTYRVKSQGLYRATEMPGTCGRAQRVGPPPKLIRLDAGVCTYQINDQMMWEYQL